MVLTLSRRQGWPRYAIAVVAVGLAAAVRIVFLSSLDGRSPFVTFYPAVIVAALCGGLPAGLLAILLAVLTADFGWMEPVGSFLIRQREDWLIASVFTVSGVMISWIADSMQRADRRASEMEMEVARVARGLALGEMATSMAHEVNQPLAGVVTNAEAALRWLGGETPNLHEVRESLALIVRDGHRAGDIIHQIRQFTQKGIVESASLDMNEVIQESVALAKGELRKRRIGLRVDLADGCARVRGDRIELQQVILNLIMNGAEAMAAVDGRKNLVVTSLNVSGSDRQSSVRVAVRDCGIGIKPEHLREMFELFYTTKPSGMGMGLCISRSIVEAHGGRIWAEANEGPGLTVQFQLPAEGEPPPS